MGLIKLGFLGSLKVDNLIILARIYEKLGIKTCVVDASNSQDLKYFIPELIDNNKINYYNIEFIIGLDNNEKIDLIDFSEFSIVLFDFGYNEKLINKMIECDELFLVTDFNKKRIYKLKKMINKIIDDAKEIEIIRVYKDYVRSKIKDKYIDYLIFKENENLIKEKYILPYKESDMAIRINSQYKDRFKIKKLSKESLRLYMDIIYETTNKKDKEIKKAYKALRKEG